MVRPVFPGALAWWAAADTGPYAVSASAMSDGHLDSPASQSAGFLFIIESVCVRFLLPGMKVSQQKMLLPRPQGEGRPEKGTSPWTPGKR